MGSTSPCALVPAVMKQLCEPKIEIWLPRPRCRPQPQGCCHQHHRPWQATARASGSRPRILCRKGRDHAWTNLELI